MPANEENEAKLSTLFDQMTHFQGRQPVEISINNRELNVKHALKVLSGLTSIPYVLGLGRSLIISI